MRGLQVAREIMAVRNAFTAPVIKATHATVRMTLAYYPDNFVQHVDLLTPS